MVYNFSLIIILIHRMATAYICYYCFCFISTRAWEASEKNNTNIRICTKYTNIYTQVQWIPLQQFIWKSKPKNDRRINWIQEKHTHTHTWLVHFLKRNQIGNHLDQQLIQCINNGWIKRSQTITLTAKNCQAHSFQLISSSLFLRLILFRVGIKHTRETEHILFLILFAAYFHWSICYSEFFLVFFFARYMNKNNDKKKTYRKQLKFQNAEKKAAKWTTAAITTTKKKYNVPALHSRKIKARI